MKLPETTPRCISCSLSFIGMKIIYLGAALLCLAPLAQADTFFVANFGANSITKYDVNGNASSFTSPSLNGPNGLALDSSGNLYVSTNSNTIEKFGPDGMSLGVFASTGLNKPLGLAFDRSGNLYAANYIGNTIAKFAPDGSDLGAFAAVVGPTGLVFDATGNLYVANSGNTIVRFAQDGTLLGIFANTGLNNPEGLAFDSLGFLYAANKGSDTIEVFSPEGIDVGMVVASGLSGPVGLGFDREENLYVVNNLTATIERITPGGTETIFASTGFSPAFLAVQRAPTLANISTRLNILTGDNVLDGGFILTGLGAKTLLIRGLGPSLADAGIASTLADPIIELHSTTSNDIIASNDNWRNNQESEINATGIAPTNDAEAALIVTLTTGAYTVIERGKQDTTGVGLIEIYDLSAGFGPELANISTRGLVGTGSNVMIGGFIVASSTGGSDQLIVRALGPSLGSFGITNPLADPVLALYDANGTLVASNDNWKSEQEAEIAATGLAPTNDAEAAILITLAPGAYTAIQSGQAEGTGVGLVEVYNLH